MKKQAMTEFQGGGASYNSLSVRKRNTILSKALNNDKMINIFINIKEGFMKKSGFTLAEVLITLGILGIVIAMTLPSVMLNFEKKRNATILKRAYSDLSNYIAMFAYEKDCTSSLSDCTPNDGQFVWEFSEYLYKKQNFSELSARCKGKSDCKEYIYSRENKSSSASPLCSLSTMTTPNSVGYYLKSPTGLYAYYIGVYMYDNWYSIGKDYFRARIHIMIDMNKLGLLSSGYIDNKVIPQHGKNLFEAYVLNSKRLIPNGYSFCQNGYYCGALGKYKFCGENGNYRACLQKIMDDGWEIKYKY